MRALFRMLLIGIMLLPLMYWQRQVSRTRCPRRKAQLLQALEVVQDAFETHPITAQLAPEVEGGVRDIACRLESLGG